MAKVSEIREQQGQQAPEYDRVPVTPEVATTWLRLNKSNRPLRGGTIQRFVRMMNAGLFKQDHPDHIMFDTDGWLINGQHRLHAIVRSQTTQEMRVLRHVPREMAHAIDIGIRRTIEDSVYIAKGDKVDRVGLRLLTRFAGGGWTHTSGNLPYTREDLIALYDRYAEVLSAIGAMFIEHGQGQIRTVVRALVARAWVARTQERARIHEFVAVICTGRYIHPDDDSAGLLLRDHLLMNSASKASSDYDRHLYRRASYALGKFLVREKIAKLRDVEGEQYRLPEDEVFDKVRGINRNDKVKGRLPKVG
jgi:hypothetical protein